MDRGAAMSTCTCPRFDTPQGSIILHTSLKCPMHGPIPSTREPEDGEWRGPEQGWAFSRSEP